MGLEKYALLFGEIRNISKNRPKTVEFINGYNYGLKSTGEKDVKKWYSVTLKMLNFYSNNLFKGIIFIIPERGAVRIPIDLAKEYLPSANTSKDVANLVQTRQYHFRIRNIKGEYFLCGKNNFKENVNCYFRPIIDNNIFDKIKNQVVVKIKDDLTEINPFIRSMAIQLKGNKCSKCSMDFNRLGEYIGIHNKSPYKSFDEINLISDIQLMCYNCHYFLHTKDKNGVLDKILG